MTQKHRKEKSKIISKAQKTINNNNYSACIVSANKVIVQIPKEEIPIIEEDATSPIEAAASNQEEEIDISKIPF